MGISASPTACALREYRHARTRAMRMPSAMPISSRYRSDDDPLRTQELVEKNDVALLFALGEYAAALFPPSAPSTAAVERSLQSAIDVALVEPPPVNTSLGFLYLEESGPPHALFFWRSLGACPTANAEGPDRVGW